MTEIAVVGKEVTSTVAKHGTFKSLTTLFYEHSFIKTNKIQFKIKYVLTDDRVKVKKKR